MIHTISKESADAASKLLEYTNFKSIGFVLHGFSACEQAYFFIKEANDFLTKTYDYEVCGFALNRELPILQPNFAIFHLLDLQTYYGRIVATDIPSWQSALNAPSKEKYLYIYDVNRLKNAPIDLIKKINESNFKIIARTKSYAFYLKTLGFANIIDVYIERFEISKFLELKW